MTRTSYTRNVQAYYLFRFRAVDDSGERVFEPSLLIYLAMILYLYNLRLQIGPVERSDSEAEQNIYPPQGQ